MAFDYKLEGVLVCDDIRQEGNGKEILIGLYNDEILMKSVPSVVPALAIKVRLRFPSPEPRRFTFATKTPSGKDMMLVSGETAGTNALGGAALNLISQGPVKFEEFGDYTFWLAIGSGESEKIGGIRVREPIQGEPPF